MNNPLDEFGKAVLRQRKTKGLTQKELAEKLGMSHRTIMQVEIGQSNPKFETVVLLSQYLDISLDAFLFPETASTKSYPKCVYDFFKDKTIAEAQSYIELCQKAADINK